MGSSGSGRFSDYPGTKPKKVVGDGTGIEVLAGSIGVNRHFTLYWKTLETVIFIHGSEMCLLLAINLVLFLIRNAFSRWMCRV